MANYQNPMQEMQYAQYGQQKLSEQDKYLIHALLYDSGVYDMMAVPTPGPSPAPSPSPSPSPTPAPAPAPAPQAQGTSPTVNVFLQLALAKVKAGDLITAQFANDLVEGLLALEARVRALENFGKTTPGQASPTPTPAAPTPSPSGAEASLSAGGRNEISRSPEPTLESAVATTTPGKGVTVVVLGDNIGEGLVEQVLLGTAPIALSGIEFTRTGLSFLTTTAVVGRSKNRLKIITSGGEDSVALTAGGSKKAPAL